MLGPERLECREDPRVDRQLAVLAAVVLGLGRLPELLHALADQRDVVRVRAAPATAAEPGLKGRGGSVNSAVQMPSAYLDLRSGRGLLALVDRLGLSLRCGSFLECLKLQL